MNRFFLSVTVILLLVVPFAFADSNGIWLLAEDVKSGVFGSDEGRGNFTFQDDVFLGGELKDLLDPSYYLNMRGSSFLNDLESTSLRTTTLSVMGGSSEFNGSIKLKSFTSCSKISTDAEGFLVCDTDRVNDADSEIGNEYPLAGSGVLVSGRTVSVSPPTCTGSDKALQWTGSSWTCGTLSSPTSTCTPTCPSASSICSGSTFDGSDGCGGSCNVAGTKSCSPSAPSCSDTCSYSGQTTCSGSKVLTCGNFDADSCLEWNSGTTCSDGCSGGSCIIPPSCTPNSYASCSSGNIWWYDSCNSRNSIKESCSFGCDSGSTTCNDWYESYAGTFAGAKIFGSRIIVDARVTSSGSVTFAAREYFYTLVSPTGITCYYGTVYSDLSVKFTPNPGQDSSCIGDNNIYSRTEAQDAGANLIYNPYSGSATMTSDGFYSGTWSAARTGATNSISGRGSSSGSSLSLVFKDTLGGTHTMTLN